MASRSGLLLGVIIFWGASNLVMADELKIGISEQQNPAVSQVPDRGSLKAQVLRQFGEPAQQNPAVGDPPISRWTYDNFTVYFEYDHVIKTVIHHPGK